MYIQLYIQNKMHNLLKTITRRKLIRCIKQNQITFCIAKTQKNTKNRKIFIQLTKCYKWMRLIEKYKLSFIKLRSIEN